MSTTLFSRNLLLTALPPEDNLLLRRHLSLTELRVGSVLLQHLDDLFFRESALTHVRIREGPDSTKNGALSEMRR